MPLSNGSILSWKSKVYQAYSYQSRHHRRWKNSLDWLNLRYLKNLFGTVETEWTEVHWVWNYFNTLIPTLYAKDPNVSVKPRRTSSVDFADTMQEVLTYHNRELDLKGVVQSAIADTVPYGIGYAQVGYEPTQDEVKALNAKHQDSREDNILRSKIQKAVDRMMGEKETERSTLLPRSGDPFLKWIPAWRVLHAPGYHRIADMPYLIVIEDIEPEDLILDPKYRPSQVKALKPTKRISFTDQMIKTHNPIYSTRGSSVPLVRLYHIWDRRHREYIVLPDQEAEELLHWEWPFSMDDFPIVDLLFNQIPPSEIDPSSYPIDDITPLKPQLIEKSLLRTDMIKARRRMAPLILMAKNVMSEADANKMSQAGIANIVLLPQIDDQSIRMEQAVRLPDDIFQVDATIDNDLSTVSGYNQDILAGLAPQGRRTATEINQQGAGLNLRSSRKTDIVEGFIREIDRRLAMICWEKCDRDEISSILGKRISSEMWPDISALTLSQRRDTISREFDFSIEAHSTQPEQIRLVEQNIWIRAVNLISASFPDVINREKLLEQFLKKIGMKEIEAIIKPEEEASRNEAEQENQLLLQGFPQVASKGDRHDVHILSHGQAALQAQAQGMDTRAMDAHQIQHAQLRQAEMPQPGARPQSGDMTSPAQAAVPELQRKGVERFPDLEGQSSNLFGQTGAEVQGGL